MGALLFSLLKQPGWLGMGLGTSVAWAGWDPGVFCPNYPDITGCMVSFGSVGPNDADRVFFPFVHGMG